MDETAGYVFDKFMVKNQFPAKLEVQFILSEALIFCSMLA